MAWASPPRLLSCWLESGLDAGCSLSRWFRRTSPRRSSVGEGCRVTSKLLNWKRAAGLDTLQEEYAYSRGATTGYTSAKKIPDQWVPTTCGYCSVGCGIEVGIKDGRAIASRPLASHPVNRGKLCPKGLAEHYILDAENRAKYPLLRKSGKLVRVGWDEALGTMVDRFRAIQEKYGRESMGVLSTGQLVTEEFYTLGESWCSLASAPSNYDGNTTLCMATAVSGYKLSFGSDGPPGCYEDLETADVVLLIGANIADNHPILCQYLDANPHKTLIVADPRVSKTAMMADLHLPLKPRSDLALAHGIAHILIRHGLIDHAYIEQHTSGFEDLARFLEAYSPDRVSRDHRSERGTALQDCVSVRTRARRIHRLDDGRESQHSRRCDSERNLQSRIVNGTHRPSRSGAIFDHRPMQCDGLARSQLHDQHARLSQVRRRGRSPGTCRSLENR